MSAMASETENVISRCISRSMHLIGKSANVSKICKDMTKISDAIVSVRIGQRQFSGGSMSEGTTTVTSDYDRMIEEKNIIALVAGEPDFIDPNTTYFVADTSKCHASYTRLRPKGDRLMEHTIYGNFHNILEDTADGKYLSGDKFADFINAISTPPKDVPLTSYRHGPCITVDHMNIHGYDRRKSPMDVTEADIAFAILCDKWPDGTSDWIDRNTLGGWLSSETIRKIQKLPCHVVPVGDPTSESINLEWRFSFLPAEQELVWNWNDVQIQCYAILKHIRKNYLDPSGKEHLSSFHMKTVVFWVSEETKLTEWNEDNLLCCINKCLHFLVKCVQEQNLPNYFMTENNLFRHKLRSESVREQICYKIKMIWNNTAEYVLNGGLPKTCTVSKIWTTAKQNVERFVKLCSEDDEINALFHICKKVNDIEKSSQAMFNSCFNIMNALDPLNMLERMSNEFCNYLPDGVDDDYSKHVRLFLNIRIGMMLYPKLPEGNETKQRCEETFIGGINLNPLTGTLYLAGFYLGRKMYKECESLLDQVLESPRYYMYTGRCTDKRGLTIGVTKGLIELTPDVPITGEPDEEIFTAIDLIFSKLDDDFVPYAMKFECALFPAYGESAFVMHPVVFALALLFFVHFFQKNERAKNDVLSRLENVVVQLGFTYQRYRALNILGFCYSLTGKIDSAISCYIRSLQDTSLKPVVTNAAAYHLAILSFGIYTRMKTSI